MHSQRGDVGAQHRIVASSTTDGHRQTTSESHLVSPPVVQSPSDPQLIGMPTCRDAFILSIRSMDVRSTGSGARASAITAALLLGILFSMTATSLAAQQAEPPQGLHIQQPLAGDCSVTITLPIGVRAGDLRVEINGRPIKLQLLQQSPVIELLQDRLPLNAEISVSAGVDGQATIRVIAPPNRDAAQTICNPPISASAAPVLDERNAFEASGYVGGVVDNFAPGETALGYANAAPGTSKTRLTAGVEAQYRIWGSNTDTRQFWIATQTLHGLRSADVNCAQTPDAAVCKTAATTPDKFFYILQHASTMEAHVDGRFEFAALQLKSDTPVRAYVSTQWGFLALDSAPKVFNSDSYINLGILSPKGPFRESLAQVGWGRSEQFQTFAHADRLKIFGTLAFDLAPTWSQSPASFIEQLFGSSRAFVAISVDQNPRGRAPDAVQTYFGVDFDLRKAFGSF